jgi:hypothetical protein
VKVSEEIKGIARIGRSKMVEERRIRLENPDEVIPED